MDRGRRAGIRIAPFLVSPVPGCTPSIRNGWSAAPSPGATGPRNSGSSTSPIPAPPSTSGTSSRPSRELGIDYFKIDFVYAGALAGRRHQDLPPVEAYRRGLRLIREAIGPDAYLLGCGVPILPSIGLVDAMRVGPDIAPT